MKEPLLLKVILGSKQHNESLPVVPSPVLLSLGTGGEGEGARAGSSLTQEVLCRLLPSTVFHGQAPPLSVSSPNCHIKPNLKPVPLRADRPSSPGAVGFNRELWGCEARAELFSG